MISHAESGTLRVAGLTLLRIGRVKQHTSGNLTLLFEVILQLKLEFFRCLWYYSPELQLRSLSRELARVRTRRACGPDLGPRPRS